MSENFKTHVMLAELFLNFSEEQSSFMKLIVGRLDLLNNRLSIRAKLDRRSPDDPEVAELREQVNALDEYSAVQTAEVDELFLDQLARGESMRDQARALLEILKNPPPGS